MHRFFSLLARIVPSISALLFTAFVPFAAGAEPAFRLLTTEAAQNPAAGGVLGLQSSGVRFGDVYVDTNVLYDLALSENVGAKYAVDLGGGFGFTAGARYVTFVGGSLAEKTVKSIDSRVQSFSLAFNGPMGFIGTSYSVGAATFHLNAQAAAISGSNVFGLVSAVSVPFWMFWSGIAEAGYDFANRQPRLSLGIERNGPSFGFRLGATYVKIDDPFLHYASVIPVLDFFWLLGSAK